MGGLNVGGAGQLGGEAAEGTGKSVLPVLNSMLCKIKWKSKQPSGSV